MSNVAEFCTLHWHHKTTKDGCVYCELDRLTADNRVMMEALERIAVYSQYISAASGCINMQDIAREALKNIKE